MSDFVIKPDSPSPTVERPIANDGFFPAVDIAALRREQRVPEAITTDRLRAVTIAAIVAINNDLVAWAALQVASGYASLDDVPSIKIDGKSRFLLLYARAVGCRAKAELVERTRDIDTTPAGDRQAGMLDRTPDELRRDALHAVRDILGTTRTTVELI